MINIEIKKFEEIKVENFLARLSKSEDLKKTFGYNLLACMPHLFSYANAGYCVTSQIIII